MSFKHLVVASTLCFAGIVSAQAADTVHNLNFKAAVDQAVADGF